MRLISRIILAVIVNALGLWAASYFIQGVSLTEDILVGLQVALVLTALNFFIRPILKFVLAPFIILTFGIGIIAVNGFMLYILDILSKDISIQGLAALFYATLIVSAINLVFHLAHKS